MKHLTSFLKHLGLSLLLITLLIPLTPLQAKSKVTLRKGKTYKISGITYKITKLPSSKDSGQVILVKGINKTNVVLPKNITLLKKTFNITEIGQNAFHKYRSIKKITINSSTIKKIGASSIGQIYSKATIEVPYTQLKKYKSLFNKKTGYLSSMKIRIEPWSQCDYQASQLSKKYGFSLHGRPISKNKNVQGYINKGTLSSKNMLSYMNYFSQTIKSFPTTFFTDLKKKGTRTIDIQFGSNLYGSQGNYVSQAAGFVYNIDRRIYVVLDAKLAISSNITHELFHVVDFTLQNRNSQVFSQWKKLNPKGFTYQNNYKKYASLTNKYVYDYNPQHKDNAWFTTSYGKTNEMEDRATFFENMFYDDQSLIQCKHLKAKASYLNNVLRQQFPSWHIWKH